MMKFILLLLWIGSIGCGKDLHLKVKAAGENEDLKSQVRKVEIKYAENSGGGVLKESIDVPHLHEPIQFSGDQFKDLGQSGKWEAYAYDAGGEVLFSGAQFVNNDETKDIELNMYSQNAKQIRNEIAKMTDSLQPQITDVGRMLESLKPVPPKFQEIVVKAEIDPGYYDPNNKVGTQRPIAVIYFFNPNAEELQVNVKTSATDSAKVIGRALLGALRVNLKDQPNGPLLYSSAFDVQLNITPGNSKFLAFYDFAFAQDSAVRFVKTYQSDSTSVGDYIKSGVTIHWEMSTQSKDGQNFAVQTGNLQI